MPQQQFKFLGIMAQKNFNQVSSKRLNALLITANEDDKKEIKKILDMRQTALEMTPAMPIRHYKEQFATLFVKMLEDIGADKANVQISLNKEQARVTIIL